MLVKVKAWVRLSPLSTTPNSRVEGWSSNLQGGSLRPCPATTVSRTPPIAAWDSMETTPRSKLSSAGL